MCNTACHTTICFLISDFFGISLVVAEDKGLPKAIQAGEWRRCSSCPQGCCRAARGLNIPCPGLPWVSLGCSGVSPGRPKLHPWAPLSNVLSSVIEVCAGHQIDRRGPQSDGLMPQAEKLQPRQPRAVIYLASETR